MAARPMTLVAAAGASGGHLYPAISFLKEMAAIEPGARLYLSVDEEFEDGRIRAPGLAGVWKFPSAKFRGLRSILCPRFYWKIGRGLIRARRQMSLAGPSAVIGFGSFASFCPVAAAGSLGIPVAIQEQNARLGLANRWLAPLAERVFFSMGPASNFGRAPKAVYTGYPLRPDLARCPRAEAAGVLGLDPDRRMLLVFGGSQGSLYLNRLVKDLMERSGAGPRGWQVALLCGRHEAGLEEEDLGKCPKHYKIWPYFERMGLLYEAADLVISRAGAATLHELAFFKKSAVLVPLEAAGAHQAANAEWAGRGGAARIVPQRELDAGRVDRILAEAEKDPEAEKSRGRLLGKNLGGGGAAVLAREVSGWIHEKR